MASDALFDFGSADLRPEAVAAIQQAVTVDPVQLLQAYPQARIVVRGYTDSAGDPVDNFELSRRRAESVRGVLIVLGFPPDTVIAQGEGEAGLRFGIDDAPGGAYDQQLGAGNRKVVIETQTGGVSVACEN